MRGYGSLKFALNRGRWDVKPHGEPAAGDVPSHFLHLRRNSGPGIGFYSAISFPRSMFIWQWNSYCPGALGISSTVTISPDGSCADFPKSGKITISEQLAVSSRRNFN